MPGLDTDRAGRLTDRDKSLIHVPPPLPRRLSDRFIFSLTPEDIRSFSNPDFDRVYVRIRKTISREYDGASLARNGSVPAQPKRTSGLPNE